MRNYGLDIVRAISIWMVLIMHMGFTPSWLKPYGLGGYGVEVFFVLSGFLIGGLLFKALYEENSARAIMKFWVRRWFRILPLYYLCLSLKYLIIGPEIGKDVLYYIFFLQNHFYGVQFYSVTWSLVIEEWFYLVTPIFISGSLLVMRRKNRSVILSILLFILTIILSRSLYVWYTDSGFFGVYGNVPLRFDSLFIGVLLAFIKRSSSSFYESMRTNGVFFYSILLLIMLAVVNGLAYSNEWNWLMIFNQTIGLTILSFVIALSIPFLESIKPSKNGVIGRIGYQVVTWTSLLTYGLYLIHPLIYSGLGAMEEGTDSEWSIDFIFIFGSYLAAWLAYVFFERPILLLRDKLTLQKVDKNKYRLQ